ncbi:MAG: hypothetical protein KIT58_09960 [Planctomycetota bacterium]|nr:hypothetical protein [Planctomycetota bacterium]
MCGGEFGRTPRIQRRRDHLDAQLLAILADAGCARRRRRDRPRRQRPPADPVCRTSSPRSTAPWASTARASSSRAGGRPVRLVEGRPLSLLALITRPCEAASHRRQARGRKLPCRPVTRASAPLLARAARRCLVVGRREGAAGWGGRAAWRSSPWGRGERGRRVGGGGASGAGAAAAASLTRPRSTSRSCSTSCGRSPRSGGSSRSTRSPRSACATAGARSPGRPSWSTPSSSATPSSSSCRCSTGSSPP